MHRRASLPWVDSNHRSPGLFMELTLCATLNCSTIPNCLLLQVAGFHGNPYLYPFASIPNPCRILLLTTEAHSPSS